MCLEKIKDLKIHVVITIVSVVFAIITYLVLGKSPETFIAIATIALVGATIVIAYFNRQLWLAQDMPFLDFYAKEDDWIYIKNVGKGAALEVNYTYKINGNPSNSYEFNALSPNQELRLDIKYPVLDSKGNYAVLTIDVRYKDVNKKTYTQNSILPIKFNQSGITFNG